MKLRIALLTALLALALPLGAKAECTGFLDCLLGMTERTEIRNDRMVEEARIKAQQEAETARIAAEQQQREAEAQRAADIEIERIKQQQYATEAQRDQAIAAERARLEQYKAGLQALVDEKAENIRASAQTQIAALQGQAQIATAGITETGATERTRIVWGWAFAAVVVVVLWRLMALRTKQQHDAWRSLEEHRRDRITADIIEQIQLRGTQIELRRVDHEIDRY